MLLNLTGISHDHEDYYTYIMVISYYSNLLHNATIDKKNDLNLIINYNILQIEN